jgi:Ran GTPase-activating protein (RanGAP) involved in mRNA processing and transport
VMASNKKKRLFKNLGIWPTTTILSYFSPAEIIDISRVNKEAYFITRKVFGTRQIDLEKINIRTVKLFRRAEKLKITKDSLPFFSQYKRNFLAQIFDHYKNMKTLVINLNFLFEEANKDRLFDTLADF